MPPAKQSIPCLTEKEIGALVKTGYGRGELEHLAPSWERAPDLVAANVLEAVEQINSALQEQSAACRSAVELLEGIHTRTRSNEQSAGRLDRVTKDLVQQAETLREDVERFRI